ncbi:Metallo-dependent hydrolase [Pisolithus orientalis]|uniref:Metallo-dependent hydrolase n=1 Tax=Pisolithus orientalis TaxID=936130 RepID=UPI002224F43E|nr:Metallo-dependent hydrolase [Pisolithus orientalis]KAI5994583.1 Metallo-dependent hydrolase [Pisolithus orientalis]
MATISGPSAAALHSLSPSDVDFLQSLPKAELHAHLNGCIPLQTLTDLAEHLTLSADTTDEIAATVARLKSGLTLNDVSEFFPLFSAIYAITSTPSALGRVTRDVLDSFLKAESNPPPGFAYTPAPECSYLELRTTPRATAQMSRYTYLTTVLDEIEKFSADQAALIVSIDRRMSEADAKECVDLAIALRAAGRRVVGLDLCGDPGKGDIATFEKHFKRGKDAGLGLTLHIAEVYHIDADKGARRAALKDIEVLSKRRNGAYKPCIEICLSSNLLSRTTDDTLPFRTTLLAEYAQLLAKPPLGLGLGREQVKRIAGDGHGSAFCSRQS